MPNLNQANLKELQKYVAELEAERGFNDDTIMQKCLLLGEELGELFRAIRKYEGMPMNEKTDAKDVSEELADIFIYLCSIANRLDIDLEDAFRDKEAINKKRRWSKFKSG